MKSQVCPECKGYLPPAKYGYKYCVHCGICLIGRKLIEKDIPIADEEK